MHVSNPHKPVALDAIPKIILATEMGSAHSRLKNPVQPFVGRPEAANRLHWAHQRNGADELNAHLPAGDEVDAQESETSVADLDGAKDRHWQLKVAQSMVVGCVFAVAD